MDDEKRIQGQIDKASIIVPLAWGVLLCIVFIIYPEQSKMVLQSIRVFWKMSVEYFMRY